jgi:hypothetical protein
MWQMIRQFLNTKQYLYYIGRHDILPPPLKGQQEKEIIEKAVSGDQKARDLLIEHNLRLPRIAHLLEILNKCDKLNVDFSKATIGKAREEILNLIRGK